MLRENSLVVGIITSFTVGGSGERRASSCETNTSGLKLNVSTDHTTPSVVFQPAGKRRNEKLEKAFEERMTPLWALLLHRAVSVLIRQVVGLTFNTRRNRVLASLW